MAEFLKLHMGKVFDVMETNRLTCLKLGKNNKYKELSHSLELHLK